MIKKQNPFTSVNFLVLFVILASTSFSKSIDDSDPVTLRNKVRQYRKQNEVKILQDFAALLAIPNIASDTENIRRNAAHIKALLQKRGITTKLLEVEGSPPVVYGEINSPGAKKTIVFYVHYDGQPVDKAQWTGAPWKPVIRDKKVEEGGKEIELSTLQSPLNPEWLIYGRSAGDDKAPVIAIIHALDALKKLNITPSINIKFFFEGEEEAGSPHLSQILSKYKELLASDAWILCDGPVHQTRRKLLAFGARGITGVKLTTYGPLLPLHSGHYGNWAPNPIVLLTNLIASMRNTNGKILIKNFYDDVAQITPTEKKAIDEIPNIDQQLKEEFGLAWTEGSGKRLEELIMLPALNLRSFHAGGPIAKNAIQDQANAVIGFRLVPNQTLKMVRERVEDHIQKQGFKIVYEDPTPEMRRKHPKIIQANWRGGYPPSRTSMDLPISRSLIRVMEDLEGESIVKLPTFGGSIPIHTFYQILERPIVILPIANHDDNQHAPNENLRLQNLWDGIEIFSSVFARLGEVWVED